MNRPNPVIVVAPPTPPTPHVRTDQKQRSKSLLNSSPGRSGNQSRSLTSSKMNHCVTRLPSSIPFQDWQLTKSSLCERGQYLLDSGILFINLLNNIIIAQHVTDVQVLELCLVVNFLNIIISCAF